MSDLTAEELLRSVHHAYQPERWQEAWRHALETEPWEPLRHALEAEFPGYELGTHTPAHHASCYTCIVYLPRSPSARIRVAGAVSLLAPVYLVYGTVEHIGATRAERDQQLERAVEELRDAGPWESRFARFQQALPPRPQLHLPPTAEMQPTATLMAGLIERNLGHRPFPLALATLPVPGIRVPYLDAGEPTLLSALFTRDLTSLP
jgi:hypothetical protein